MTTIKNATGSKAVNIRNNDGSFVASYVQIYNGEEQVLEVKRGGTLKAATKWANQKLGIA